MDKKQTVVIFVDNSGSMPPAVRNEAIDLMEVFRQKYSVVYVEGDTSITNIKLFPQKERNKPEKELSVFSDMKKLRQEQRYGGGTNLVEVLKLLRQKMKGMDVPESHLVVISDFEMMAAEISKLPEQAYYMIVNDKPHWAKLPKNIKHFETFTVEEFTHNTELQQVRLPILE
jgi:uncharacterized protein with von Willebrand factor type A (vWA) domain